MTRPYLNQLSFHAPDVDSALSYLDSLRQGIALLIREDQLSLPVMCSHPASKLPITPDYKVISQMVGHQGGRFRDTILFFLSALDQRAPVFEGGTEATQEAAKSHIIDGDDADAPIDGTMALICCSLESGVLLSLPSEGRWQNDVYSYSVLLDGLEETITYNARNISDIGTAKNVLAALIEQQGELTLENWDAITGGALKTDQVDHWLKDSRNSPGLTQLVLRTLNSAKNSEYYCDGELIKKLKNTKKKNVYEVRAFYRGSNNVRVLFTRAEDGSVTYGFAGLKTSPNWYDHAIGQVDV